MDPETQRLVKLLKVTLRLLNISQGDLADRLDISPSYLSKLLSGTSGLRLDHLIRICRAVGLQPAEFFDLAYPANRAQCSKAGVQLREMLQELDVAVGALSSRRESSSTEESEEIPAPHPRTRRREI